MREKRSQRTDSNISEHVRTFPNMTEHSRTFLNSRERSASVSEYVSGISINTTEDTVKDKSSICGRGAPAEQPKTGTCPEVSQSPGPKTGFLDDKDAPIAQKPPCGKHLFKNSRYYDITAFRAALPQWTAETCQEYWEKARDYSEAKGAKYADWIAAVRNWERMDRQRNEPNPNRQRYGRQEVSNEFLKDQMAKFMGTETNG
jgi:hypothetical protein